MHGALLLLILAILLPTPTARGDSETLDYRTAWDEVAELVADRKLEAADAGVVQVLERAQLENNQEQWARALIQRVRLRGALRAHETAVRDLRAEAWPDDPAWRGAVELYHAQALIGYLNRYSYEIRRREFVASEDELDLKVWNMERLLREIDGSFLRVWSGREAWGEASLGPWARFVIQNNYPARIRGTLRDAVTYMWSGHLANQAAWLPEHGAEISLLDLDELLTGGAPAAEGLDLADPRINPILKIAHLLDDLRNWHEAGDRDEAALEAELNKLRILRQSFPQMEDKQRIREHLEGLLDEFDLDFPWWSYGQWLLARFFHQETGPDHLMRAHDAATKGARRHPETVGGELCVAQVQAIEQGFYELQAMSHDAAEKRSTLIRYRNLDRIHFRAWRYDLPTRFEDSYTTMPNLEETRRQIMSGEPDLTWTVDLPPTDDFKMHRHFTGVSAWKPGAYVVAGSMRRDFEEDFNNIQAVNLVVTDLVVSTQNLKGRTEFLVRSASAGGPVAGAKLVVKYGENSAGDPVFREFETDSTGRVSMDIVDNKWFTVLARKAHDLAFLDRVRGRRHAEPPNRVHSFLYTDRAVYRPGQTVHWKVVAYQGTARRTEFHTLPDRELTVKLSDSNGQDVARIDPVTNAFGSASGSFRIPAGGLLGRYQLSCSLNGGTTIQVEQYKRPTFEVSLLDPEESPQLNRTVTVTGKAGYLFGLPVTEGEVTWQVERVPRYRHSWRGAPPLDRRTVASGKGALDADGRFTVEFETRVDQRLANEKDLTFAYQVTANVTDEGGETRSASRTFRLGFVSVVADISSESGFLRSGHAGEFSVLRSDLNRTPRSGRARWSLHLLDQPARTMLPADLLRPEVNDPGLLYPTQGDHQRARWEPALPHGQIMAGWNSGRRIAQGRLTHDEDGLATIELDELEPGAYRIEYETEDDEGRMAETSHEFIVAGARELDLKLPLILIPEYRSVPAGGTARFLVHSNLKDQDLYVQTLLAGERVSAEFWSAETAPKILEIEIAPELRTDLQVRVSAVRDHQFLYGSGQVLVPWNDKLLDLEFLTFRDELAPGSAETFRIKITARDGTAVDAAATELLASMYDRSLDEIGRLHPFNPASLFATGWWLQNEQASLGSGRKLWRHQHRPDRAQAPVLQPDRLRWGPQRGPYVRGSRGEAISLNLPPPPKTIEGAEYMVDTESAVAAHTVASETFSKYAVDSVEDAVTKQAGKVMRAGELYARGGRSGDITMAIGIPPGQLRQDFSETAFFLPHVQIDDEGVAVIEFQVPDSVTDWNLWVHALTRDMASGAIRKQLSTVKDLMVRPYLPRFLREGDEAELKVVVNNAGEKELSGRLLLSIEDPATGEDIGDRFGLTDGERDFKVEPAGGAELNFPLTAPVSVGEAAVRVVATAGELSDGELRPLPILPSRMHLIQSRFATLDDRSRRELTFADMGAADDPSLIHDQLVVTIDAQLLGSVLNAVPYLIEYPYECTEQLLNRYLSASILAGVYGEHPHVKQMAEQMKERETLYEAWNTDDPNRRMLLEETPWLRTAQGGKTDRPLINVLDPEVVELQRRTALDKLERLQDGSGGFPWFPGGRPSPHLTLYVLQGLARGEEFGVEASQQIVGRAWKYLAHHYDSFLKKCADRQQGCWPQITFLNYLLSSYPEEVWENAGFTADDRELMLDHSFAHWREHSNRSLGFLALTLLRAGREDDAHLVYEAVMDGAKTDRDLGTYWAPEDRAWLWHNDTVESHAFILRILTELDPEDERRKGLVKWLLLQKKLGHWKSTRATAEVIYALVHYMQAEGTLAIREEIDVTIGELHHHLVFEPDRYTGKNNQIVVPGAEIVPEQMATVVVEKETRGLAFASATWHFSTEKLPEASDGDLFAVGRAFFRRHNDGRQWVLEPLAEGAQVSVGDQIEVQLSVSARQAAEYVHLRDPRPGGCEPEAVRSGYRWQIGLGHYEEVRDSGANFFFDRLPTGQFTLSYRLRATQAGTFRVGPAVLQSMYAPEFAAHSAGEVVQIGP